MQRSPGWVGWTDKDCAGKQAFPNLVVSLSGRHSRLHEKVKAGGSLLILPWRHIHVCTVLYYIVGWRQLLHRGQGKITEFEFGLVAVAIPFLYTWSCFTLPAPTNSVKSANRHGQPKPPISFTGERDTLVASGQHGETRNQSPSKSLEVLDHKPPSYTEALYRFFLHRNGPSVPTRHITCSTIIAIESSRESDRFGETGESRDCV